MVSSVVFFSLLYDEMKFKIHLGREMVKWAIFASWMWPLSPSGDRNVIYCWEWWFSSAITLPWICRSEQQTGHDGV